MSIVSYDLSIISDQEAADRLGVKAAEAEMLLDLNEEDTLSRKSNIAYAEAANRVTIALDILALRKAQAMLAHQATKHGYERQG